MGLRTGPLKIRIEPNGAENADLKRRAATEGIVLAAEGEDADLVAHAPGKQIRGGFGGALGLGDSRHGIAMPPLSGRELEILEYLADGWSNAEIASVLRIGIRTVRFHLEGLYAKLGVSRRGEAVSEGARLGFVRFDF